MLFSDNKLIDYLNRNFECAWESVKPVPIMTVDFGDGRVISRSMHGNVAGYVCLSDKTVVDTLPGIYGPRCYEQALESLRKQALKLEVLDSNKRSAALQSFHENEISRIENEMKAITTKRLLGMHTLPSTWRDEPEVARLGDETFYKGVLADDAINETTRRLIAHNLLIARTGAIPNDIYKPVYKKCLDLDLDDPYLGLGSALISNYPGESQN